MFLFASLSLADYQVVQTLDAPDTNIAGLGYGNGSLWAVDIVTEFAYEVDPATGSVSNSWYLAEPGTKIATGAVTFANNTVYIAAGVGSTSTSTYCYKYTAAGAYSGNFSMDC